MKISIAMATYNGADYLQEQLQSFVSQTRHPDELIITDDCSADQTEAIVREFAKNAPFKVEFHQNERNLGYCGNFNAALMKTTGDLVFLSDQDDVWFPEKIECMSGVAQRNPQALVVMNDAALTDGDLNEVGLTKLGQIRSAGFRMDKFVMGCCCGIRRELLDFCLPINPKFKAHDNWVVAFADGLNAKVVDNRVLQYYRRHASNESQFIANKTTKVNRVQVLLLTIKQRLAPDSLRAAHYQAEQLELFIRGLVRAQSLAHDCFRSSIAGLLKQYLERLELLKDRIDARDKELIPRIIAVVQLAAKGRYRHSGGVKTILGDLLG